MHIGTGIFEGKEIRDIDGNISTRALTIKEELFSIIGSRVLEGDVLDINDDNGMYGIDALSRGAVYCHFLNNEQKEVDLIRENLRIVGLEPDDHATKGILSEFLTHPPESVWQTEKYDVIFLEEKSEDDIKSLPKLAEKIKTDGILIVIYPFSHNFEIPEIKGVRISETREFEDKKAAIILKD